MSAKEKIYAADETRAKRAQFFMIEKLDRFGTIDERSKISQNSIGADSQEMILLVQLSEHIRAFNERLEFPIPDVACVEVINSLMLGMLTIKYFERH